MNYINYKKTEKNDMTMVWKNSYFTSVKDLDMYQVLPRPYLWSFDGGPKEKLIKKIGGYTWKVKQKHFSGNVLNLG